jgi:hypothetical protein
MRSEESERKAKSWREKNRTGCLTVVSETRLSSLASDSRRAYPDSSCPSRPGRHYAGPPGALQQVDRGTLGVRARLGHPKTYEELRRAMIELRRTLEAAEEMSFVQRFAARKRNGRSRACGQADPFP